MIRLWPPAAYHGICTIFKAAIIQLGGLDAFASSTRVGRSQLSAYCDVNSGRYVTVDVALDADLLLGEPVITGEMARLQGFRLVRFGARRDIDERSAAARLARDFGQLFADLTEARADSHLSAEEKQIIARDLHSMVRGASEMLALFAAVGVEAHSDD